MSLDLGNNSNNIAIDPNTHLIIELITKHDFCSSQQIP